MHFAHKMPGISLQDLWTDIAPGLGAKNLGDPTQKPELLLERIIAASSNPGDTVLDLQATFTRTYDEAGFSTKIDYGHPPHKLIAAFAYEIWQEEGCPHGRDKEHWYEAVERLKPANQKGTQPPA